MNIFRAIIILIASCFLAVAEESTDKVVDTLIQEKREGLLAPRGTETILLMVLHDAPSYGINSQRLSWSITNHSGTATITSWMIATGGAPQKPVTLSGPLDPEEAEQIIGIATNLLLRMKPDPYQGWGGPLYGLDFELDHPKIWNTVVWRKWCTSTNILSNPCLVYNIQLLRSITSNAVRRVQVSSKSSEEKATNEQP